MLTGTNPSPKSTFSSVTLYKTLPKKAPSVGRIQSPTFTSIDALQLRATLSKFTGVCSHSGGSSPESPDFVQTYAKSLATMTCADNVPVVPRGEPIRYGNCGSQPSASYPSPVTTSSMSAPGATSAAERHRRSPTRRNDPRIVKERLLAGDANHKNG